jgi:hypothetical protein
MPSYFDLGDYRRTISTSSPEAQLWFDRGLNWTYGFNHEEAVNCFKNALEADPDCPMAYWGIAYAAGPNYNFRWDMMSPPVLAHTVAVTYEAAQKALALSDKASAAERALILAVQSRAPQPVPVDDCSVWDDESIAISAMTSMWRRSLPMRSCAAHPGNSGIWKKLSQPKGPIPPRRSRCSSAPS